MRFIYERNFEGSSLFAKAVHLAACDTPGAALVRARKDMLKGRIADLIARAGAGSHVRIASIAAGPSQEVFELLRELKEVPGMIDIVLYDQDASALSFAFSRLNRLVDARWSRRVRIRFLHDSIKRLLRDPALFQDHAPFDVVICAGLYDYLDGRNATTLTRSLYASVRPGGQLYVGNVVPELPTRWLMEQHLDWFLKYKTREEMLAFTGEAAPDAHLAVIEESTGFNPFICLTRP
jgi:SAM-dependent methyltransferase